MGRVTGIVVFCAVTSGWFRALRGSRPAYVIAEAADAHYGNMDAALEMVSEARRVGADAIKFQHHIPDEEMLRGTPMSSNMTEPLYEFLLRNSLKIDQHRALALHARELGIDYLCTPFSLRAARELATIESLPAFKIGSGEMTDRPTLEAILQIGKPLLVSTGMSTQAEVDEVYSFLCDRTRDFALLHCVSAYPPRAEECAIDLIPQMNARYPHAVVGYSDHYPSNILSIAAIALGAKIVEKHVTLDKALSGPDAGVSVTFDELSEVVSAADTIWRARGQERKVFESEKEIRIWARRSLVYLRDLSVGHQIENGDLWGKRPGNGVPSARLPDFVGRKLRRSVHQNTQLREDDFF